MPRKGYKTLCVTDETYNCIQKIAQENKNSIPQYIKRLIEKEEKPSMKENF
jgi:predicted CopG family antitoxin